MDDDFPAAHSMDLRWYAIDEAGHVGIFDTRENGPIPDISVGEDAVFLQQLLRHLYPEREDLPWEAEELTALFGVFFYDYDDSAFDPIAAYKRTGVPQTPLHADQLPPSLRQLVKDGRLANINFASHELVQPLEQYECIYWYEEDRVAYLSSDGKTVRPIPGMEPRFAAFRKQFCQENPEVAAKLLFEGLEEEPEG